MPDMAKERVSPPTYSFISFIHYPPAKKNQWYSQQQLGYVEDFGGLHVASSNNVLYYSCSLSATEDNRNHNICHS